jgi:transposase InsO family protein
MASRSRELNDVTAEDPLTKNGDLFARAGSEVLKMIKIRVSDSSDTDEIENDTDEAVIDTSTTTDTPYREKQSDVRRRGISGSSKIFDVEERMEDDTDDLPEQGMTQFIQTDLSQIMNEELAEMIERAIRRGLPADAVSNFTQLITDFRDVFRIELGRDPPADVEPLRIELIDEGLEERRLPRARRFAPLQQDFLNKHLDLLQKIGVVSPCNAPAAAPIVLVKKKNGDYRMCVDLRKINANTKAYRWPLPKIAELLPYLANARVFASFDLLRGFWQFPVEDTSSYHWAFITHNGQFKFNRVVMGGKNSAAHFQRIMQRVVGEMLYKKVLVYIDDVLVFGNNIMDLVRSIRELFQRLRKFRIFLKPSKCELFSTQVLWCGHLVDAEGIAINPAFLSAVRDIPVPENAATLRQFLASANWVRNRIPQFAKLVTPLQELLVKLLATCKRKTTRVASKALLKDDWTAIHTTAFNDLKESIANAVKLAHVRDEATLCLFTDASDLFFGAILTQIPADVFDATGDPNEWPHEPLGFISGAFRNAQLRWSVCDKEGYAIKIACEKFTHLLIRERGFILFTDHRNLTFIFNPRGQVASVAKPQADRLERWAMFLRSFSYDIFHINGEDNVWADMLSRWGAAKQERSPPLALARRSSTVPGGDQEHLKTVRLRVRPDRILTEDQHTAERKQTDGAEMDPNEAWPQWSEIREAQSLITQETDAGLNVTLHKDNDGIWCNSSGQVFIPQSAFRLQQRLMVIAHAGAAGHRGQTVTLQGLRAKFMWQNMEEHVRQFVRGCLLCCKTRAGTVIPPPLGKALRGDRPGVSLHMDYITMWEGAGLLVLKDGFSSFVLLWEANSFDAATAEAAVIEWASLFGVPRMLITDGGTHFVNNLIQALVRRFRAHHHVTTAYAPWANGVIERVNREIVKLWRVLMAEVSLAEEKWATLRPLVQAILNRTAGADFDGLSPSELHLARRVDTPLDTVTFTSLSEAEQEALEGLPRSAQVRAAYESASAAVHACWLRAADIRERRRLQNGRERERAAGRLDRVRTAREKGKVPQFQLGEFVLVAAPVARAKFKVKWMGPFRIVETLNDYVYVVEDVVTARRKSVHVQRLRLFAEASFQVTEDVRNQAAYDDQTHVENIVDWRETDDALLELRVRWLGFTPAEDTWEPINQLHEDQPALVERFLRRVQRECDLAPVLLESYGSAQAGQEPVERRATTTAAAAAAAAAAATTAATGAGQRGKGKRKKKRK